MTNPADILSAKRARIAELEATVAVEKAELRGMEMMAEMLGGGRSKIEKLTLAVGKAASTVVATTPARSFGAGMTDADWACAQEAYNQVARGRQPGSISKRWRTVLWHLDRLGGNFSPIDIVAVVRDLENREMRPADAKRQMDNYAEFGFVSGGNGTYNVTDEFRTKFADAADGLDENGEAAAEPDDRGEGASDSPAPALQALTND